MTALVLGALADAGLDAGRVGAARAHLLRRLPPSTDDGCYPSAVLVLARDGVVGAYEAYGDAVRYGDEETLLPLPARVPARIDTVYDLASVTKTVTAVVVLALAERGVLALDQPVADLVPAFDGPGKDTVVLRQLLAHTAGLPAMVELWREPASRAQLFERAARVPLAHPPGSAYLYSDVGPMLAGAIVERAVGARLDEVVADLVAGPLELRDLGYLPPPERRPRVAATEAQKWTGRVMVQGDAHDENAWALGGISGHAGLFGTAWDVASVSHMLVTGGRGPRGRVLGDEAVEAMCTDHGWGNGLGLDLNRAKLTGELASPATACHAGFTGTFHVLDRRTRSVGVLLTNRVHPSRHRGAVNASRVAVAEALLPATERDMRVE